MADSTTEVEDLTSITKTVRLASEIIVAVTSIAVVGLTNNSEEVAAPTTITRIDNTTTTKVTTIAVEISEVAAIWAVLVATNLTCPSTDTTLRKFAHKCQVHLQSSSELGHPCSIYLRRDKKTIE